MTLSRNVNYGGNCRQAFEFLPQQHLGAKITMLTTHGEQPDASKVPASWKQAVLHARLDLGDSVLMGADIPGRIASNRCAARISR